MSEAPSYIVVEDPNNGSRNCYQRYAHRELESIEVRGVLMCPSCYIPE